MQKRLLIVSGDWREAYDACSRGLFLFVCCVLCHVQLDVGCVEIEAKLGEMHGYNLCRVCWFVLKCDE